MIQGQSPACVTVQGSGRAPGVDPPLQRQAPWLWGFMARGTHVHPWPRPTVLAHPRLMPPDEHKVKFVKLP